MAISEIQAIQQEFKILLEQINQEKKKAQITFKNVSVWNESYYQQKSIIQLNKHKFGIYADKQLSHLVISQFFNFQKIAKILSYSFQNQSEKYTQTSCRQRWYEIHRDWSSIQKITKEIKQNKRIESILSMRNPFQNYNISQYLQKMQQEESEIKNLSVIKVQDPQYKGYNIFKDSIRKIDDLIKFQQEKKQFNNALLLAKSKIQQQKPMLYTPCYQEGLKFDVKESQLTNENMKQLMSHPIQLDLVDRQLSVQQLNPVVFQSKILKQIKTKQLKQKEKKIYQNSIEDNWDQYESD